MEDAGETADRWAQSMKRARRLALETTDLVGRARETVADVRNRVYAIRLMREVRQRKLSR